MGGPSPTLADPKKVSLVTLPPIPSGLDQWVSKAQQRRSFQDEAFYEGWADPRLGQAYDLIDAIMKDRPEIAADLKPARDAMEAASEALGESA